MNMTVFNPGPPEPGYSLPLQTVLIQISWLPKKPTDLDLHCLSLRTPPSVTLDMFLHIMVYLCSSTVPQYMNQSVRQNINSDGKKMFDPRNKVNCLC